MQQPRHFTAHILNPLMVVHARYVEGPLLQYGGLFGTALVHIAGPVQCRTEDTQDCMKCGRGLQLKG